MQNVIPIVIEQQHVVAYADGATVLIDTGAPISYGDVEIQWRDVLFLTKLTMHASLPNRSDDIHGG